MKKFINFKNMILNFCNIKDNYCMYLFYYDIRIINVKKNRSSNFDIKKKIAPYQKKKPKNRSPLY